MNLFAIFDSSSIFLRNWVSLGMVVIIFSGTLFVTGFSLSSLSSLVLDALYNNFYSIVINKKEGAIFFIVSLLFYIILNNLMGLFPYLFTASRHLIFTLGLGLTLWLVRFFVSLIKNLGHLLVHLTPIGTPRFLIFFMVCIESLSLLVRPITLSVRLMANIVAGHLLMVLLRGLTVNISKFGGVFTRSVTIILLGLEFGVAFIQAYVFSILILLYLNESLYVNKK